MFVDDKAVIMPTVATGTIPASGSARLEGLNSKQLVLSRSGFSNMPIAYPSLVNFYTSSWDCENTGTLGNANDWMTQAIAGGTMTAVTTGIASGTPTNTEAIDLVNHPGVVSINSGATANSGGQIAWGNPLNGILIKGGERFDCIFSAASLTNTLSRIGFHDGNSATDVVDGVYFDVGLNTGAITARTRSNSFPATSVNLMTITANTWYYLKIQINNNATSATFFIYDMLGAVLAQTTITDNFPITAGRDCLPKAQSISSTGGARLIYQFDYIGWSTPLQRGATI
jgi:hypothetical protein